jgi:hypothetical protein
MNQYNYDELLLHGKAKSNEENALFKPMQVESLPHGRGNTKNTVFKSNGT